MQIYQAILLGFTQGFCEFLPISSSGHLILMQRLLGVDEGGLFFDVTLHLGTLIPVFIIFRKQIFCLLKKPKTELLYLIIATVPAILVGALASTIIDGLFYSNKTLGAVLLSITFLLTALELYLAQQIVKKRRTFRPLSKGVALSMGIGQALAIAPGLSRSGTVISFGAFSGLGTEKTATFAFLMSIPVILGASVLSGAKAISTGEGIEILPLAFGVLASAVTGYIAISIMLGVVRNGRYKPFCIYLVFVAIISLVSKLVFGV